MNAEELTAFIEMQVEWCQELQSKGEADYDKFIDTIREKIYQYDSERLTY